MKRLLLPLLLGLLWSQSAWAAPNVGTCTALTYANNVGTSSAATAGTPTTNNIMIVGVSGYTTAGNFTLSSTSDNRSNTYNSPVDNTLTGGVHQGASINSGKMASISGALTVTAVPATNSYYNWMGCEFSGLDATTWVDKTSPNTCFATTTTGITCTIGSSNAQSGDLVVACTTVESASANVHLTVPTGYTELWRYQDETAEVAGGCFWKVESGTGPSAVTTSHDIATGASIVVVTFKPAAGGGGGSTSHSLGLLGVGP